jgi:cell division protein FtsL
MKGAKKISLGLILSIILVSTVFNIRSQFSTLNEAEQKNTDLEVKIDNLTKIEQKFKKQIEYATSSASIEKQTKELLGLGTENDVWLNLTPEKKIEFYQDVAEVTETPKYQQWLNLFTQ